MEIDKKQEMEPWLDKQEAHHKSLSEGNIKEKILAESMEQVKTMLTTKGWDETLKYISDMQGKCKGSNMVGPHALAGAYTKIIQKMRSLNYKWRVKKCQKK